MTRRTVALKLGFSCWLIYTLHFATNMVRENYLALAIGDHFSFRLHEYANLHDDIFETRLDTAGTSEATQAHR